MATAVITNTFLTGTPAVAAEVNTNFANLVDFLNNSVVHRDGSKAMTANFDAGSNKIVNVSTGTASGDAVNFGQLTASGSALPLGKTARASVTSPQGSITTITDLTSLTVTFTAVTGRLYKITGEVAFYSSVGDDQAALVIADSSNTQIQIGRAVGLSSSVAAKVNCTAFVTGASGSVTYKLRAARSAGSGNITMDAGATAPAFILVEDIGLA